METFLNVGGRRGKAGGPGIDFDELGVSEVVELLDDANMEAVVRDFGDRNPQEDPVIHFYELFLKEYDAKKRMQRGVFYTPRPVVSYIVRSRPRTAAHRVRPRRRPRRHHHLGRDGEAPQGSEDPRRAYLARPALRPDPRPATGTGTFLVEVIDVIHQHARRPSGRQQGHSEKQIDALWNEYVPKHLLPRLHGYELMMAPYAIAHLKIGLKLYETGYRFGSDERARIYLTNALEPAQRLLGTARVRRWLPRSPTKPRPSTRSSGINASPSSSAIRRIQSRHGILALGFNSRRGLQTNSAVEKNHKSSRSRMTTSSFFDLGNGILRTAASVFWGSLPAMVTCTERQPRDLRHHLSATFDRCYCLDLHGSVPGARALTMLRTRPVFQIMTGVAIIVAVRTEAYRCRDDSPQLSYRSLEKKFAFLGERTAVEAASEAPLHRPTKPYFHFAASGQPKTWPRNIRDILNLPELFGTGDRHSDKEGLLGDRIC